MSIGGLKGGHSGAEIDKGRGSGNDLISRVLYSAMERLGTLRIADLRGGQFDNVICTRCDAVVAVPAGKAEDFAAFIREFDGILKNEYAATDGGVTLTCAAADADAAYSAEDSSRLLHVLLTLPQGVEVMSADFPGLVQTSLNLGVMTACGDGLHFSFSIRSSVATQKELLLQRVRAIVEYTGGGTVSTRGDYPGHGDVLLQADHRTGRRYHGHPRRSGVRPAHQQDARTGRRLPRAGAARHPLPPGAAGRGLRQADVRTGMRGAEELPLNHI